MGTKALNMLNIKRDNLGRILVTEVKIDNSVFALINMYNNNTKRAQLHTLKRSNKHSRNFQRHSKQKCHIRWRL